MKEITCNPLKTALTLISILAAMVSSCDENPADQDPEGTTRLEIYAGNNQAERIDSYLPSPLTVQAVDVLGEPKQGITVNISTADVDASVTPSLAVTDASGLASFNMKLGTNPGTQHAKASCEGDSVLFQFNAVSAECMEESIEPACDWPGGHIFITTTSSEMLGASGSVVIDLDPMTDVREEILETSEILIDLAFSARGELFVMTDDEIFKVDPDTRTLVSFLTFPSAGAREIEPDFGSILTAVTSTSLLGIFCPSSSLASEATSSAINTECLAVDPLSRDAFIITGVTQTFRIYRYPWTGRNDFGSPVEEVIAATGSAAPRGMCADSSGTVYVVLDGDASERSIGRLSPDGTWDDTFIDLFDFSSTGRYGDVCWQGGNLFLIDTFNNRLLVIDTETMDITTLASNDFSRPGSANERYGIAACPSALCP